MPCYTKTTQVKGQRFTHTQRFIQALCKAVLPSYTKTTQMSGARRDKDPHTENAYALYLYH